jgi:hypothetical protein
MDEGPVVAGVAGLVTHDFAKPHHPFTLEGTPAVWGNLPSGLPTLDLDGAADFLQCLAANSLDTNFTNEDWSFAAWINKTLGGGAQIIMAQGAVNVDGWEWFTFGATMSLRTNQGGTHSDISAVNALTASVWQLVGVTRHGAAGHFYVNGLPVNTLLGTGLLDAVSVAGGNNLLVGQRTAANFFDGLIAGGPCGPRIWSPRVLSDADWLEMFASERHWLGV